MLGLLGTVLLVIISPFVLWLLYWYYTINHFEKYLKAIPGPKPLPLFGNALELRSTTGILPKMAQLMKTYNGNYKIYIGSQPYLMICETQDLDFILNSNTILTKSNIYRFAQSWLGLGLLTSRGSRWRKHRKIITPAFHFKILEEFVEVFNSSGDILVSKLCEKSEKGSLDIYPFVTRCTLDTILETAMGTSVNAQDELDSEYVKCVNILLEILMIRSFSLTLSNDFLYLFSKTYRRERQCLKVVHSYTRSVINKRRAEFLAQGGRREAEVDSLGRKKKWAFLDSLLEYSLKDPSFTEEDIRQEVDTFMFEGHDTTATSISFILYALATNSDVQKKAYAELQTLFSDNPKRSATYRDLQEMKYLEMVIKESLRLYTTVPFFGRTLEKDVDWNGMLLPKGLMIHIFAYGLLHFDKHYENPEVFNPERFNSENTQGRQAFSYVPFSAGPRNCIGQKFAMLEMKSIVSNVLRNFELLPSVPSHKVILRSEGVLKSDNGVFIQLRKRNH